SAKTIAVIAGVEGGRWAWGARSLAFSSDGKTLAAGCSDGSIRLWDVSGMRADDNSPAKVNEAQEPQMPAPDGIAALIKQLNDKDEFVRLKAVKSLEKLGPLAKDAVPALTEATKDDDTDVRSAARRAIEAINPKPLAKPADIPALVAALADK